MAPKILIFAGSVRNGAYSERVADAAMRELSLYDATVTRISLVDYPLPIIDEDLEKAHGIPENAMKLGRLFAVQDGFLICSPEYNSSIPPLLKNTIDWISRISHDKTKTLRPYKGKVVALCSSSDGNFAGIRGLYHLRAVFMAVGGQVITEQCSVAHVASAFNHDGTFRDQRTAQTMSKVCYTLIEMIKSRIVRD